MHLYVMNVKWLNTEVSLPDLAKVDEKRSRSDQDRSV